MSLEQTLSMPNAALIAPVAPGLGYLSYVFLMEFRAPSWSALCIACIQTLL